MQDIGGIRVVLKNVEYVYKIYEYYKSNQHYYFAKEYDYIKCPKGSGYRSIHFVIRGKYRKPERKVYESLKIEVQVRTELQHIWATTVETVGFYLDEDLKSRCGSAKWLKFFKLASSLFAYVEKQPLLKIHESILIERIVKQVRKQKYSRINDLKAMRISAHESNNKKRESSDYLLIILNMDEKKYEIEEFKSIETANERYMQVEIDIAQGEKLKALLLSVSISSTLLKAYPNFFLDTKKFISQLNKIIYDLEMRFGMRHLKTPKEIESKKEI